MPTSEMNLHWCGNCTRALFLHLEFAGQNLRLPQIECPPNQRTRRTYSRLGRLPGTQEQRSESFIVFRSERSALTKRRPSPQSGDTRRC